MSEWEVSNLITNLIITNTLSIPLHSQAGCEAVFHYLRIGPLVPPVHDVNL